MSQRASQGPEEEAEQREELVRVYTDMVMQYRQEEEELINSQSPRALTDRLVRQEALFRRVKTPSTMAHDCEGLSRLMKITVSQSNAVNLCPKSLNLQNVRSNLVSRFGGGVLDLEALGDWSLRKSRVLPAVTTFLFGLGQFQPIHKARTQRVRTQKDPVEDARSVDQRELSDGRANQLLMRAKNLCEKLKKVGDTPLARAITTPVSFAQTVQNAFDFSHLVRDGHAGLQLVNDCAVATAKVDKLPHGDRRRQCVVHLRQSDYQRFIEDPARKGQLLGTDD
jgi:hypothetical protein